MTTVKRIMERENLSGDCFFDKIIYFSNGKSIICRIVNDEVNKTVETENYSILETRLGCFGKSVMTHLYNSIYTYFKVSVITKEKLNLKDEECLKITDIVSRFDFGEGSYLVADGNRVFALVVGIVEESEDIDNFHYLRCTVFNDSLLFKFDMHACERTGHRKFRRNTRIR